MTTQIVFNIDPKVKAKAMKRAKKEGIPLATFLKIAVEAYAEGECGIGLIPKKIPSGVTRRLIFHPFKN